MNKRISTCLSLQRAILRDWGLQKNLKRISTGFRLEMERESYYVKRFGFAKESLLR